jgi:hypothetical protein
MLLFLEVAAGESTRKVDKALMQYFFLQQPAVACLTVAGPTACLPFFCRSRIFFTIQFSFALLAFF